MGEKRKNQAGKTAEGGWGINWPRHLGNNLALSGWGINWPRHLGNKLALKLNLLGELCWPLTFDSSGGWSLPIES